MLQNYQKLLNGSCQNDQSFYFKRFLGIFILLALNLNIIIKLAYKTPK